MCTYSDPVTWPHLRKGKDMRRIIFIDLCALLVATFSMGIAARGPDKELDRAEDRMSDQGRQLERATDAPKDEIKGKHAR